MAGQASSAQPHGPPSDAAPPPEPMAGVDWDEALRSVRGSRPLLATIIDAALTEIPRLTQAIDRAMADRDATALRLAAHTLKGSVRYFGAGPAFELSYQLELAAHQGRLDDGPAIIVQLKVAVARITADLAASQAPSRQGEDPT
jgi:two-component system, sensor histidine kinase and response regulator